MPGTAPIAGLAQPEGSTGCRWLMLAAEMAGLLSDDWRPRPEPGPAGWALQPRAATRTLAGQAGSVRVARDFTRATLRRWGVAERGQDVAMVVSELLTNALRHALPAPGDILPRRPIRLGLLQPGPCVLCAVGDPSSAVPVPRPAGPHAETGRGLHLICALSDQWGCTTPSNAGKVVWATFYSRPGPGPGLPGLV